MKFSKIILTLVAFAVTSHTAFASLITQADFSEELSLPFAVSSDVRLLEAIGEAVTAGVELDDSNEVSNPGGYSGHADMDLSQSGLLTLTGRQPNGFADYQLAVFALSNIMFDIGSSITSVTIIGLGNEIFNSTDFLTPLPSISFTANSLNISYAVGDATNTNDEFEFGDGFTAQFQLVFADGEPTDVPAPATLSIFALALLGLRFYRRNA